MEIHLFLAVLEFGDDPGIITDELGLQPTESWIRGEPVPGDSSARRTHSRWALHSGLSVSSSFEDQLGALLDKLEPVSARVNSIAAKYTAVVWVAAYASDCNPRFHVNSESAALLGALGLGVDIDVYSC